MLLIADVVLSCKLRLLCNTVSILRSPEFNSWIHLLNACIAPHVYKLMPKKANKMMSSIPDSRAFWWRHILEALGTHLRGRRRIWETTGKNQGSIESIWEAPGRCRGNSQRCLGSLGQSAILGTEHVPLCSHLKFHKANVTLRCVFKRT